MALLGDLLTGRRILGPRDSVTNQGQKRLDLLLLLLLLFDLLKSHTHTGIIIFSSRSLLRPRPRLHLLLRRSAARVWVRGGRGLATLLLLLYCVGAKFPYELPPPPTRSRGQQPATRRRRLASARHRRRHPRLLLFSSVRV